MKDFGSLFYNAAVIDLGTSGVKADFAGEETPSVRFFSVIGRPKYSKIFSGDYDDDIIGPDESNRGLYKLYKPMRRGLFTEKGDTEKFVKKIFKELHISEANPVPVLLTQPVVLPKSNKAELAEIVFNSGASDYLFFATQPVLSLFAHGKSDGMVLECGGGITQIATIFNGFKIENAFEQTSFGGTDVSLYLKYLFKRNGISIQSSSEDFIYSHMKKTLCYVEAEEPKPEVLLKGEKAPEFPAVSYTLPDGTKLQIRKERMLAGEVLFNPSVAGLAMLGIPELVQSTIQKIDLDLLNHLSKNIYLAGGTTQMKGFVERFAREMSKSSGSRFEQNVVASNGDRTLLAWKGGSIVTNMSNFVKLWISKKEYQEEGNRVFLRKFF